MSNNELINYIEFHSSDLKAAKKFFTEAFGWTFEDYGPDYTAFSNSGISGGFFKSEKQATSENGSALVVLYSDHLETTQNNIENAGGTITKPIFSFPGGRRFHFTEPGGNELAVWSE
jgi:predicted enzyme related to lactoylglutathione lyase